MKQIKGYIKKETPQTGSELAKNMLGVSSLFSDFEKVKDEVKQTVDNKISEVEQSVKEGTKKIDAKVAEFENTAVGLIKDIQNIPTIQGNPGQDADEERIIKTITDKLPTEEQLVAKIVARIPKPIDEKALIQKVISHIPESKADLKIIQEKLETDPMSVIEKIMALPEGKFKLKSSQIDGLEQTISAFRNQLSRGYLHGGGTYITVSATAPTNPTLNQLWYDIS